MAWSEIYDSYKNLPEDKGNLNVDKWVEDQKFKIGNISNDLEFLREKNQLLIENINDGSKILDYGGALGVTYLCIKDLFKIDYHIVETPKIVKIGKEIYGDVVKFYEDIPELSNIDVVYMRATLQYTKNWKDSINSLLKNKPSKVILPHTSCGNIPTYLTTQVWNNSKVPYWFVNIEDLKKEIEKFGYKLTYENMGNQLLKEDPISDKNWNNIPKEYRLKNTMNLIFES